MAEWLQIFLRSLLFVFLLFFLIKGLGKKHLNRLGVFDYISGIVLSGLVAISIIDVKIPILTGVLAISVWFFIPLLVNFLSLKSKIVRDFVQGKGTVIIKEGKILEDNLKKERFATDDLLTHLRDRNIFKVADVEFALLEPTGKISVLPKSEVQPLTKKDVFMNIAPQKEVHTVIMDGEILLEPLSEHGKNPAWLETELSKINVTKENVFLGQLDGDGQLTVDVYDDMIVVPSPSEKPLLLATLKKAAADLEIFALATENQASKQRYETNAKKMEKVVQLLETYLK